MPLFIYRIEGSVQVQQACHDRLGALDKVLIEVERLREESVRKNQASHELIQRLTGELSDTKNTLVRTEIEIKSQAGQWAMRQELMQRDLDQRDLMLQEAEGRLHCLGQDLSNVQSAMESLKEQLVNKDRLLHVALEERDSVKTMINAFVQHCSQAFNTKLSPDGLSALVTEKAAEAEHLRIRLQELESQIASIPDNIASLRASIDDLQGRLKERQVLISDLERSVAAKERTASEALNQISSLTERVTADLCSFFATHNISIARREVHSLLSQLTSLQVNQSNQQEALSRTLQQERVPRYYLCVCVVEMGA